MNITATQLRETYANYIVENNRRPSSVKRYVEYADIKEQEFYHFYGSISAIEDGIWHNFFEKTTKRLESDPTYREYCAREKMLAFYYTLCETLNENDDILQVMTQKRPLSLHLTPPYLVEFKECFLDFTRDLLREAIGDKEVIDRTFLSTRYPDALWLQTLLIIKYRIGDKSGEHEKTDLLIEKAVNFAFDLMGYTPLDSAYELFKFLAFGK